MPLAAGIPQWNSDDVEDPLGFARFRLESCGNLPGSTINLKSRNSIWEFSKIGDPDIIP